MKWLVGLPGAYLIGWWVGTVIDHPVIAVVVLLIMLVAWGRFIEVIFGGDS